MKKPGNNCEFALERDAALMDAYRQELRESGATTLDLIAAGVARRPTTRFWVSEERAVAVVSAMLRGIDVTGNMHASKRRMYEEIFRRIKIVRARDSHASLAAAVSEVIYSEAPEFYLSARYVRDRIISTRGIAQKQWKRRS